MKKTPRLFDKSELVIQIDDSVIIHPLSMHFVKEYAKAGYKIAVNEFQFAPRYLGLLDNIDYIKINIAQTSVAAMRNIAEIAQSMHKKYIVTNIETEEQYKQRLSEYRRGGTTEVLGYCTNACKRRLFTFITVWQRLERNEIVTDDDPIFEQFNAKCPKCGTVYPDQDLRICENCSKRKGMIFRLLAYFKPFKLQLITVLICMLATSAISLLSPIISGQILFDQVISKPSFSATGEQLTGKLHELKYVYMLVGVMIGMALLQLFVGIMQNRANAHMSTRVTKKMKNDIFSAMCGLSISYFNQNPTGRLVNRVNYDAVKIRNFYIDGVPHLIVNALNNAPPVK